MRALITGDVLIIRTRGWAARAIQVGTRSRWNHAAIYIGNGRIIEAQPGGVVESDVTRYPQEDIKIGYVSTTPEQRTALVEKAKSFIGTPYGWNDIVALALMSLGIRGGWVTRTLRDPGSVVCSQLVALCYARVGLPLVPDPYEVTPGDLADAFLNPDPGVTSGS